MDTTRFVFRPIVVAGPLGAGKDYVAARILDAYAAIERQARLLAVGDYYYHLVAQRHGLSIEQVRARKPEFRTELQDEGERVSNMSGATAFAIAQVRRLASEGRGAVVTARKPHEILALRHGVDAYAIGVDAPLEERADRIELRDGIRPSMQQLTHAVERSARELPVHIVLPNGIAAGPLGVTIIGESMALHNRELRTTVSLRPPSLAMRSLA